MKYSIVISSALQLVGISNFAITQMVSHFENWSSEDLGSTFEIKWIKDALILETNSGYLLNKWLTTEKLYLNYLMNEQFQITSEYSCQDSQFAKVA